MVDLPFGKADYHRSVAKEARIQTRNRYYETNPILSDNSIALLARPALKRFAYVGQGPIRAVYSQTGNFSDALFVVSGTEFYRVELDKTVTYIIGDLQASGSPQMAATGPIGTTPPYLFMCDGKSLYCYIEDGYSLGTITGSPANDDTVLLGTTYYQFTTGTVDTGVAQGKLTASDTILDGTTINIGGTYYKWVSGSVNTGSPAGTSAAPWRVKLGGTNTDALKNMYYAVGDNSASSGIYSTDLTANSLAIGAASTSTTLTVNSLLSGTSGNSIVSTVVSGTGLSWSGSTFSGGADSSPDGSSDYPWMVAIGASDLVSWQNFGNAVSALGDPGTDYSTYLQANPDAQQVSVEANSAIVRANENGIIGNIPSTVISGSAISWGHTTLTGGGEPSIFGVAVPDDVGVISLGYIAGYVVVIPAQGDTINGRFYWIAPGETVIDALDFATAERSPDPVFDVVVFGDQFWLPGANTTEVWYFTGNSDAPVKRLQGVTFDRGTWEGTAKHVKESMIIVDSDGGVFQVSGGLERISNPSIEERIREAIMYQSFIENFTA